MDAVGQIRSDLRTLKQRRGVALAGYAALLAAWMGLTWLQPAPDAADGRDAVWGLALALLLTGTLVGVAITLGLPLVSQRWVSAAAGGVALGTVAALLMTVVPGGPRPEDQLRAGMPCFLFGTGTSGLAMLVLGILSGRLWRRFPNPALVMALGMTGVGLALLHMRCGATDPVHLFVFHLGPLGLIYGAAHRMVRARDRLAREG